MSDRQYQNIKRRLIVIGRHHNVRPLNRRRMDILCQHCCKVLGEDGITDVDLWTLYRLTARGLFDD